MRRVRVVLAFAVVVCAFGALSAPAFAKKVKPPVIFGKFVASIPGKTISPTEPAIATGHGELTSFKLGPVEVEECAKEVKSVGKVESESSETLFQNIKFKNCIVWASLGKGEDKVKEKQKVSFNLGFEFHSNRSLEVGQAEESDVGLTESSVSFKVAKTSCTLVIPAQTIPIKAEAKPEKEYEAASYTTLEDKEVKLKKFPAGFQDKLVIEMEFKKLEGLLKPNAGCTSELPVNEEPESPRFGYIEYRNGELEAELEEVVIKNGNLGFEPAA